MVLGVAVVSVGALVAAGCAGSSGQASGPYNSGSPPISPTPQSRQGAGQIKVDVKNSDLGEFLAGSDGRTLYVFNRDAPNKSNCADACLGTWPPFLLMDGQSIDGGANSGAFKTIDTPSGKQVTLNGAPLYFYAGDNAPGDTNGHGVLGVWFVARPDTASTAVIGVRGMGGDAQLVGPNGMTLYVFAKDAPGVSNCNAACLQNWPALTVPNDLAPTAVDAGHGELGFITRADNGQRHVTYNSRPLYFFAGDLVPGDTKGDGVGGVWSVEPPSACRRRPPTTGEASATRRPWARNPGPPSPRASRYGR
jgi:predicted lipoprotein with Yx(FWY)xxD motif